MSSEHEVLLRVDNLVKHFPITQGIIIQKQTGAVHAVDGISFDIYKGETLGLVGESGLWQVHNRPHHFAALPPYGRQCSF